MSAMKIAMAAYPLDKLGNGQAYADKIAPVRADGGVPNRAHRAEQAGRADTPTVEGLQ